MRARTSGPVQLFGLADHSSGAPAAVRCRPPRRHRATRWRRSISRSPQS